MRRIDCWRYGKVLLWSTVGIALGCSVSDDPDDGTGLGGRPADWRTGGSGGVELGGAAGALATGGDAGTLTGGSAAGGTAGAVTGGLAGAATGGAAGAATGGAAGAATGGEGGASGGTGGVGGEGGTGTGGEGGAGGEPTCIDGSATMGPFDCTAWAAEELGTTTCTVDSVPLALETCEYFLPFASAEAFDELLYCLGGYTGASDCGTEHDEYVADCVVATQELLCPVAEAEADCGSYAAECDEVDAYVCVEAMAFSARSPAEIALCFLEGSEAQTTGEGCGDWLQGCY